MKSPVNKRDPAKTRARILQEASRCFARSGFRGTSLSEILEKTKVNKRMVYHYFGSKEGLYRAVHLQQWRALETWFAEALTQSSQAGAFALKSQELLLEAVSIFHEFIARNQFFVRLMMWDGLEGGKVSRSLWKDIRGPIYRQMEALVLQAQHSGVLPPDLKPGHLVVSMIGEISFYFAYANSLRDIFTADPTSPEAIAERKEQVLKFFQKVLNPVERAEGPLQFPSTHANFQSE